VIAQSSAYGGEIARAKRTHKQRKERPQQQTSSRFARGVSRLAGIGDGIGNTLLCIGFD